MMNWIENLNQLPLLTGSIFIIAGFIMLRFPPKKINMFYGYRTISSMKSQERWDFSQKYSAKELMKFGGVILPFCLLGLLDFPEKYVNIIVILAVFVPILTTEIALRKKFTNLK
jgi:uncharacterized membrane protein